MGFVTQLPKFDLPQIPQNPVTETISKAKSNLTDVFIDFPFVDDSDLAHAKAAMIQAFVREMIDGPTPLYKHEAPKQGSGKGLLSDVELIPALGGADLESITQAKSNEEWEKRLTAILREGPEVVRIDNVSELLSTSALSSALTKTTWTGRDLGHSRELHLPVHCAWHLTANNPVMDADMVRRCVRIRIDHGVEHPELLDSSHFTHPEIKKYALERRPVLIWSILVLVTAWIAAGKPAPACTQFGSYENWRFVLGGILQHAGIPGFLDSAFDEAAVSDPESGRWRDLVALWLHRYGCLEESKVKASDLFPLAKEIDGFSFGKGETEKAQQTSFGMQLAARRDQVFTYYSQSDQNKVTDYPPAPSAGTYQIKAAGKEHRLSLWRLEKRPEGGQP